MLNFVPLNVGNVMCGSLQEPDTFYSLKVEGADILSLVKQVFTW